LFTAPKTRTAIDKTDKNVYQNTPIWKTELVRIVSPDEQMPIGHPRKGWGWLIFFLGADDYRIYLENISLPASAINQVTDPGGTT
jgi:hypothetical protein